MACPLAEDEDFQMPHTVALETTVAMLKSHLPTAPLEGGSHWNSGRGTSLDWVWCSLWQSPLISITSVSAVTTLRQTSHPPLGSDAQGARAVDGLLQAPRCPMHGEVGVLGSGRAARAEGLVLLMASAGDSDLRTGARADHHIVKNCVSQLLNQLVALWC